MKCWLQRFLLAASLLLSVVTASAGSDRAQVKVSGHGILGNLKIKNLLKLLVVNKTNELLNANAIEDCVVVIFSELERDGYLQPDLSATVLLENGESNTFRWHDVLGEPLPQALSTKRVHFQIREGVRYHYCNLHFEGLETIKQEVALRYFVDKHGLLKLKEQRIYTPEKAKASARSLEEAFEREGFRNASVIVTNVLQNDKTGDVDFTVRVDPGLRFTVRTVRVEEFARQRPIFCKTSGLRPTNPTRAHGFRTSSRSCCFAIISRVIPMPKPTPPCCART